MTVILDAREWQSKDDFYNAFFRAVGAPEWHGRNFNALNDSIAGGSINELEVPYAIIVKNYRNIGEEAASILAQFKKLIDELAERGVPVSLRFDQ